MEKRMSINRYRLIDLGIFAVILIIFESIASKAALSFSSQPYSISIVSAITCIIFMRWGIYGCFHAALGGFVFCFVTGGSADQYIIYMVGNLFSAAALLLLKRIGPDRIREKLSLSLLLSVLVSLLMQLGRGIVAVVLGASPDMIAGFVLTDSISTVFAMVIIGITRKLDGVFEDQKSYLIRLNREENKDIEEGVDEGKRI